MSMKAKVISEKCIGCGSCVSLTNQKIFDFNDEGIAEVIVDDIKDEDAKTVETAIEYCPTQAIELEKTK